MMSVHRVAIAGKDGDMAGRHRKGLLVILSCPRPVLRHTISQRQPGKWLKQPVVPHFAVVICEPGLVAFSRLR